MQKNQSWGPRPFTVRNVDAAPVRIVVKGRDRWALETLVQASGRGITSFHCPAPRLSAYVHNLRNMGVRIETITEPHEGPFGGTHGRYVLRSNITPEGGAV